MLNFVADRAFKKHETTVKPFEQPTSLIETDVFSFSRNPMYLGMVLVILGVAVMLGSLAPFVVVLVLAAVLDRVFIVPEELALEDAFGDEFHQYCRRVRRWI